MSAHWLPRARALALAGLPLSEIAAAVGRSRVAVWRQLRGRRSQRGPDRSPGSRDPEIRRRSYLRALAREQAAETGEDVEAIYARWDVVRIDRSLLWDLRRPA